MHAWVKVIFILVCFIFVISLIKINTDKYILKPSYHIGVLTYSTSNLGDWYQTAAALYIWWNYLGRLTTYKEFLDSCIKTNKAYGIPIYWLDRDYMSNYSKPANCSRVILIGNAWWLHKNKKLNKYDLPLPDFIYPIYVSVHLQNKDVLSDPKVVSHYKMYEPIGCRDESTVSLLKSKGVNCYFSSCLTTTLNLDDPQLGFKVTKIYPEKISIDSNNSPISNTINYEDSNKYRIPEVVQNMINYRTSPLVTTMRLHIWMPIVSNGGNAILWDNNQNKPYKEGDVDIQGQKQNRFSGLFSLVSGPKKNLDISKKKLYYDTLNRIAYACKK